MDHSQFWKHHLSAFYVYNSIPFWIVIKTWSWDALSLLGYEAEEHQLFATNPLNSWENFYGQFLMFETLVTSAKLFMCRVKSSNQLWAIWLFEKWGMTYLRNGFRIQALLQSRVELGSFWIKTRGAGIITNEQFSTPPNKVGKPPQKPWHDNQWSVYDVTSERQKNQLLVGSPCPWGQGDSLAFWQSWCELF